MAFSSKKFGCLFGNAGGDVRLYVYDAGGDAITAAGYFPKSVGLNAGDKVLVFAATGAPVWHNITVSAAGEITATAC